MADWHAQIPASAVVEIVPRLQEGAPAPAELPIRPRPSVRVRQLVVLIAVLFAVGCFVGIVLLWTSDTPGVVFDLVFTVLGALLGLGVLAAVGGWHSTAALEEHARDQWREAWPAQPYDGVVVDREVSLGAESGDVTSIALLVRVGDGEIAAAWSSRGRKPLLQPQVPGVGSAVRVWRSTAGPVLVEAVDPTVVQPEDAR